MRFKFHLGSKETVEWMEIEGAGHVVYLERPETFFPILRALMEARSVDIEVSTP